MKFGTQIDRLFQISYLNIINVDIKEENIEKGILLNRFAMTKSGPLYIPSRDS